MQALTPLPLRFRPGAKAFIVHDGKILIVRERIVDEAGERILHDLPGGGIENGETLHEGLHREVFEEVGLRVQIERPIGCWEFMRHMPNETVHILCSGFQCSLIGDSTVDVHHNPAEEDIFEAVWMTKEELLTTADLFESEDLVKSLENVRIP